MTEKLYKKVGRKYVPVSAYWYENERADSMKVGTFRLTYAYADGGSLYEYNVTPATAPFMAAAMIAKNAMCEAIHKQSQMRPSGIRNYTKKQLELIEKFKADMGGMYPSHWQENSAYEIADAAIKAVIEFKP